MYQPAPPEVPAPIPPPRVDVFIDLSGLADLIWRSFIDHIDDLAAAIISPVQSWVHATTVALWDAVWHSSANIVTQIPADLSYRFGPYLAIATDPVAVAVGGATLALVLLGLRTISSVIAGEDDALTHILTRLIPAVSLTISYPALVVRGVELVNTAAEGLASRAIGSGLGSVGFVVGPAHLDSAPLILLWVVLIYFAIRLLIRAAYGLFRLLVALVFGPVALILWAIPQTEWVTWLWLREVVGWATTPLLVAACLAIAVPMASGRDGQVGAFVFGIAGLQAAYDLVGLLSMASRSTYLLRGAQREAEGALRFAARLPHGGLVATAAHAMTPRANKFGYR